jgi:hypothetical protein
LKNISFNESFVRLKIKMKFITILILSVLCISITVLPMSAESFDFAQNEAVLQSSLSLNNLKMTPAKKGRAVQVEIEGMVENTPFKISGNLGPLIHAIDPNLKWPVHIIMETSGANLTIGGTIKDLNNIKGIDLDFVLTGQNLVGFEDMFRKKVAFNGNFYIQRKFKG